MIPLEDVQAEVLRAVAVLAPSRRRCADALGLVLAEPVVARRAGPAVREHRDGRVRGAGRGHRRGVGRGAGAAARRRPISPAGHAPTVPVGAGEAMRIMTGAPIPDGADAIVMVERTTRDGTDGVLVQHAAERR